MEETYLKIDWERLEDLEYQTTLEKSLKNTLRKFDKEGLFEELRDMIKYYGEAVHSIPYNYRIKAISSCKLKYDKYYPNTQTEKVFNDVLGLRIVVESYETFDKIDFPEGVKIADMRHGKANDDGYRGIHVYLQKDHFHYPIEIQFVTPEDEQFNAWLHDNTYKYIQDRTIGKLLRQMYEDGIIKNDADFRKELEYVLCNSKEI